MRIPIIRAILFYLVMVCFLVPIGYFALWGVKNARQNFVSSRLTRVGDRRLVIGYNNNSIHSLQFYCTNLETGVTSTRVFGPMLRALGGDTIGTKVWLFGKANKNQFTWQMADLENDRATAVQTMEVADVSELGGSTIVIANQFIRVRSNTLESVDPLTGALKDRLRLPIKDLSYLRSIFETNRFLLEGAPDPASKLKDTFLFEIADGKFRQIKDRKSTRLNSSHQ